MELGMGTGTDMDYFSGSNFDSDSGSNNHCDNCLEVLNGR